MSDLVPRLRWRANKYDGSGWMMPNCVVDLREAAERIEQLEARVCSLWWEGMDYMGRNLYLDEHSDFNAPEEKDDG